MKCLDLGASPIILAQFFKALEVSSEVRMVDRMKNITLVKMKSTSEHKGFCSSNNAQMHDFLLKNQILKLVEILGYEVLIKIRNNFSIFIIS